MSYQLVLHEHAHKEYIEAYEWYEQRQKGLGDKFMNNVERKLNQILAHPEHYGKKQNCNFREVKVENFPYSIVYEFFESNQLIHIAAIYHAKRNPARKYRSL